MAKEIASSFVFVRNPLAFQTRKPILASDWKDLVAHQHRLRARHGERLTGLCYEPPLQTQSTSYTQATLSGDHMPLNEWSAVWGSRRPDGGGNWRVTASMYADEMDLRVTLDDQNSSDQIQWEISGSSSPDWYEASAGIAGFSETEWDLTVEMKSIKGSTAELFAFDLFGAILTPSQL